MANQEVDSSDVDAMTTEVALTSTFISDNIGATPSPAFLLMRTVYSNLQIALGVAVTLANGVALILFFKSHFLRRKANIFIFSLCISDLLCGITIASVGAINNFFKFYEESKIPCLITCSLSYISVGGSLYAMAGIAIETYIHIGHPFLYSRYEDSKIHATIAGVVWLAILASGACLPIQNSWAVGKDCYVLVVAHKMFYSVLFTPTEVVLLVVIAVAFGKILQIARRQRQRVTALDVTGSTAGSRETGARVTGNINTTEETLEDEKPEIPENFPTESSDSSKSETMSDIENEGDTLAKETPNLEAGTQEITPPAKVTMEIRPPTGMEETLKTEKIDHSSDNYSHPGQKNLLTGSSHPSGSERAGDVQPRGGVRAWRETETGKDTMETGTVAMETTPPTVTVTMATEKLTMEDGKVAMEDGKITMEDGKVTMEDGKVAMATEKVTMEDGKVSMEDGKVAKEAGDVTMETGQVTMEAGQVTMETVPPRDQTENVEAARKKTNRNKLVIILLAVMYACWFPTIIQVLVRSILSERPTHIAWYIFSETANILLFGNSLLNPFLYQRFSPDVRRSYKCCGE